MKSAPPHPPTPWGAPCVTPERVARCRPPSRERHGVFFRACQHSTTSINVSVRAAELIPHSAYVIALTCDDTSTCHLSHVHTEGSGTERRAEPRARKENVGHVHERACACVYCRVSLVYHLSSWGTPLPVHTHPNPGALYGPASDTECECLAAVECDRVAQHGREACRWMRPPARSLSDCHADPILSLFTPLNRGSRHTRPTLRRSCGGFELFCTGSRCLSIFVFHLRMELLMT